MPVAGILRKCMVLGGESGSEALRDWARRRELQGYPDIEDLPRYRLIPAPLLIDGIAGYNHVTRQPISPAALPDVAQEFISEEVPLTEGVASLESLAMKDEEIALAPAGASNVVLLMNSEDDNPYQQVTRLYWSVSPSAVRGAIDQIRTALTLLVAELRATMADDEDVPSADAASQAVGVVVTGKRSKVHVTTAQSSGDSSPTTATQVDASVGEGGFWTRWRILGAFVVGAATVAAAVIAAIETF